MTVDTPLLDELADLGDAGARLLAACETIVETVRHERALLRRANQRRLLDERVALFFAGRPDATANDACRAISGGRQDVLDAVRNYKAQAA